MMLVDIGDGEIAVAPSEGVVALTDASRFPLIGPASVWDVRFGWGAASVDLRLLGGFFDGFGLLEVSPRLRVAVKDASVFVGWRVLDLAASEDRPDLEERILASGPEAGFAFAF